MGTSALSVVLWIKFKLTSVYRVKDKGYHSNNSDNQNFWQATEGDKEKALFFVSCHMNKDRVRKWESL